MTYDPHIRDSSWRMVAPGLYLDPAGNGHIFPDEVFAEISRLHPEDDFGEFNHGYYEVLVQVTQEYLASQGLKPARIIRHERDEN